MNSKLLFVLILLFQIFIVINCSCSTTKITNGGSCSSTSQCQTSLLCVSGTCQCPSGSQWFWSSSKNICAQCPVGWIIYGNHCYYIKENSFNRLNAFLWCDSQGATLMIVNDQAEFNFIVNVYNQRYGNANGFLWIDGTRTSNNIVWTDGSSLENSSPWWCSGEPNNSGGNEGCVTLKKWDNVGPCLNDDPCDLMSYSICERDSY